LHVGELTPRRRAAQHTDEDSVQEMIMAKKVAKKAKKKTAKKAKKKTARK